MSLTSLIDREDTRLAPAQLGYMNSRTKGKAYDAVLDTFEALSESTGLTRAFIARRLGKKPEQITRWLGGPGNWTLDTLSNLLAAMGYEAVITAQPLSSLRQSNDHHPLASLKIGSDRSFRYVLPFEDGISVAAIDNTGQIINQSRPLSDLRYD